jgi:L-seryl-tRNA(Ser) seleniumtransferase
MMAAKTKSAAGTNIYEAIGVRPIINCRGTFTIITGSQSLPEVKRAMDEASRHYVQMDELMDAVGKRLAELTQAEWGMVTNGCAAALAHATSACIAGGDPEKMQRMPVLTGLKNEVIVPRHSRNDYDHAVRMTGVTMITVDTAEQFEAAFNPRTAMVMVLSSPRAENGPLSIKACAAMAKKHNVPVLVDAAAEELKIPNIHLAAGATMVAYSGGKCMRGPQTAGLLLGPKNLIQAAWINSAPHHAFGRSMKVGKEEIMGMLAAVEMWTKRDHEAEWKQWEAWNASIAARVTKIPGVTTEIQQPEDLSNHAPVLRIKWDPEKLGITGPAVAAILLDGKPRITVVSGPENSVGIMPYMMMPGDNVIAADALYAVLSRPPKQPAKPAPQTPASDLSGQWNVHLEYVVGDANHTLAVKQQGPTLSGTHKSDLMSGDLRGNMDGTQVRFRSAHRWEGKVITYDFTGRLEGDQLAGTVSLGEYGTAQWRATRA